MAEPSALFIGTSDRALDQSTSGSQFAELHRKHLKKVWTGQPLQLLP